MINIPDSYAPHFPEQMRTFEASLVSPEADFTRMVDDASHTPSEQFSALYGLLNRLRREKRWSEYRDVLRKYEPKFSGQPYFDTFRVVAQRAGADDSRALKDALKPARRAVEKLSDEAAVLHQYAELVASLAEVDSSTPTKLVKDALKKADKAVEISIERNANHHSTRARCFLLLDDFQSARTDIATAISLEDPSGPDFMRRVSSYESIRSMIAIRQAHAEFMAKQEKVLTELTDFRSQQLQLLGLLAALIALIVVGATVATGLSGVWAMRLMLVSGGTIGLVFAGLSGLLAGARFWRVALSLLISVCLIAAGIFYWRIEGLVP